MSQTAAAMPANLENPISLDPSKVVDQQTASTQAKRPGRTTNRSEPPKAEIVLKKLRLTRGVTVAQIIEVTGWQAHSVRGFLSAVVRKKLGLSLVSDIGKDGQRRYRIVDDSANTDAE